MNEVQYPTLRKFLRLLFFAFVIACVFIAALYVAKDVSESSTAKHIVGQFGYLGILVIAIISGLNAIVPVPAATLVPIFIAAGLWMPLIIAMLVLGTTIADGIGFFIGHWSREFAEEHYPKIYEGVLSINERFHYLLFPLVFLYAAFIPFPNEAIIIPIALVGIRFRKILFPLVLGNFVNQAALAYGAANVFTLLF